MFKAVIVESKRPKSVRFINYKKTFDKHLVNAYRRQIRIGHIW